MSEYQIKREAIREYEDALRVKKAYSEALEHCSEMLQELVRYYERLSIPIPDRIEKFMASLVQLVDADLPTALGQPHRPTENGTLPVDGG